MTTDLNTTGPEERDSIWLGIGKVQFIVPTTWCVTTSLEEAGATSTAPSRPEKPEMPPNNGTSG